MRRDRSSKATGRKIPKSRPEAGARSDQVANRLEGKFTKGRSGNPNGRPKGIEDKRVALRSLLEPHAPKLIKKVVAEALKGDIAALRICMDRLVPTMKAQDTPINLGRLAGTLVDQGKGVLGALSEGRVTPDEAASLMQTIAAQARIVEVDDLVRRITALEERSNAQER